MRFPLKPEFFKVSSFQPLRLKHLHCDDLHIILSLSAVQIYEYPKFHINDVISMECPSSLLSQCENIVFFLLRKEIVLNRKEIGDTCLCAGQAI